MTVIVYSARHRVLASDSRCSDEHEAHFTSMKKVYRLKNKALFGAAGHSDTRDLRALLSKTSPRKLPSRTELAALKQEIDALIVFPNGQCYCIAVEFDDDHSKEWHGSVDLVTDPFVAIGTGMQFALGALEVGATPAQAVRAACKRDLACALPLQWEGLDVKGNSDQPPPSLPVEDEPKKVRKR